MGFDGLEGNGTGICGILGIGGKWNRDLWDLMDWEEMEPGFMDFRDWVEMDGFEVVSFFGKCFCGGVLVV